MRHRKVKVSLLIVLIVLTVLYFLVFFLRINSNSNCKYNLIEGDLGTKAKLDKDIEQLVNSKYLRTDPAPLILGEYKIFLKDFYYNSTVNFVVYRIQITKSNEGQLSDNQFEILAKKMENADLGLFFSHSSKNCTRKIYRTEGNTYICGSELLSSISNGMKTIYKDRKYLDTIEFYLDDYSGNMALPDFCFSLDYIDLIADEDGIYLCRVSEYGLNIIWNLDDIIQNLKNNMVQDKENGKKINEEDYGILLYDTIKIIYKNGKTIDISERKQNHRHQTYVLDDIRDTEHMASTNVLFENKISIDDIDAIKIDDVLIYRDKEYESN